MKIPKKPRYDLLMRVVAEFFEVENIVEFPVNPHKIIRRNRWALVTYSELAIKQGVSIQDVISSFETEDGCVIRTKSNYTIAYNDKMDSLQRIRFTLMHEIGHIVLGHLLDFDSTQIRRGGLTNSEYDVLEREANAFARNVLEPPFIFERFQSKFTRTIVEDAAGFFSVSPSAIRTRIKALAWDLEHMAHYVPLLMKRFHGYMNRILDSKHCLRCNNQFINRFARYCPICSHTRFTMSRGVNAVIYSGFETDENSRLKKCARCDNEEIGPEDNFCKVCSTPVVNKCTNIEHGFNGGIEWECGTLAPGNARYCTQCRGETVFFKAGILKPWEQELEDEKQRKQQELEVLFGDINN